MISDHLPILILGFYGVASVVTFLVYQADKTASKKGHWRIPEATLHLLALIGGWPGALFAQQILRHKTRKQPFRFIFWITVILNLCALVWLIYSGTAEKILTT